MADITVQPEKTVDLERIPSFQDETTDIITECKAIRLSLHLIAKRHLPPEAKEWSQEKMISELNKIKRVRLDRENIGEIDSLELFSTQVTHLYLQCNKIKTIDNLECLPNLQVLVLSVNQIKELSGIEHLEKLIFLDVSENCLGNIDCDHLPKNLIILNASGNPDLDQSLFRSAALKSLPKLKQLNGEEISIKEKIAAGALNKWGEDDDVQESDEETEEEEDGVDCEEKEASSLSQTPEHQSSDGTFRPPSLESSKSDFEMPLTSSYKQLPKIESSIQGIATDMLLRSQDRLEDIAQQHKRHLQQMTNIKIKAKIRPMPQMSTHE